MEHAQAQPPPGFDDLSAEEKIEYVQSLWDRIAASPDEAPVPDWHRDVVRARLKSHRDDPDQAASWPETREAIERRLRGSGE